MVASLADGLDARPVSGPQDDLGDGHLLSIGEVVAAAQQFFPDVSHSSLRFLEREGLIHPTRTAGGHRLYSPSDLERIVQIKSWQVQRLSLSEIRERLAAQAEHATPDLISTHFLKAMLDGDPRASQMVMDASEQGLPLGTLFQQVLQPAMAEVGMRWASGDLRIGQEHEITEATRGIIAELAGRHALPEERGPRLLAACVAGEGHDLGLRMIVAMLRSHGLGVDFLGANVGHKILVEETLARRPPIVLLSATLDARMPAARTAVTALRQLTTDPPAIFTGGAAVEQHREQVAAWGAVHALRQITPAPPKIFVGGAAIEQHREQVEEWGATPLTGNDLDCVVATILRAYVSQTTRPMAALT